MSGNTDQKDTQDAAFRKIFIGGLSYSTDEEKLKKYFSQYGTVQDAVVMKDPTSKRSRGFGFITFLDLASVDNALSHEPHTIDSRKVEAKRAVPRSEISRESGSGKATSSGGRNSTGAGRGGGYHANLNQSSNSNYNGNNSGNDVSKSTNDPKINLEDYAYNKIFVGGLHYDTRDAEFRTYFEQFGKVISAEVMFNRETHKSRGFGFIVFELEAGAVNTCAVNEHTIDGKVVEVKRAIPRSKLPAGTPASQITKSQYNIIEQGSAAAAAAASTNIPPGLADGTSKQIASGTITSVHQQQAQKTTQPATATISSTAGVRKPYSVALGAGSTPAAPASALTRGVTNTSYAAALKLGGGYEGSTPAPQLSSYIPAVSSQNGNLQTLLYGQGGPSGGMANMDLNRLRSNSEPIVKFDGTSALNGNAIAPGFDLSALKTSPGAFQQGSLSATNSRNGSMLSTPQQTPQTSEPATANSVSSGMGSIAASLSADALSSLQAPSISVPNMPWLSSPPSVSIADATTVPSSSASASAPTAAVDVLGSIPIGSLPPAKNLSTGGIKNSTNSAPGFPPLSGKSSTAGSDGSAAATVANALAASSNTTGTPQGGAGSSGPGQTGVHGGSSMNTLPGFPPVPMVPNGMFHPQFMPQMGVPQNADAWAAMVQSQQSAQGQAQQPGQQQQPTQTQQQQQQQQPGSQQQPPGDMQQQMFPNFMNPQFAFYNPYMPMGPGQQQLSPQMQQQQLQQQMQQMSQMPPQMLFQLGQFQQQYQQQMAQQYANLGAPNGQFPSHQGGFYGSPPGFSATGFNTDPSQQAGSSEGQPQLSGTAGNSSTVTEQTSTIPAGTGSATTAPAASAGTAKSETTETDELFIQVPFTGLSLDSPDFTAGSGNPSGWFPGSSNRD